MNFIQTLVDLAASNPHISTFLAVIPVLQSVGYLLAKVLPSNTIAAKIAKQVAAFPVKVPAPAEPFQSGQPR